MNRVELLDKLTTIKPALATSDLIAELSHFWFFGQFVIAYNDRIGMAMPCKTDFVGALPGTVLLGLLGSSRGDSKGNISLEQEKKELIVQAGRTKIRLAMLDIPENLFLMPKPNPNAKTIGAVDKLMIALAGVMRSLSDDTSRADYQGIALIPENGQLTLFATDSQTISAAWVNDAKMTLKKRVILPTPFCEQMLVLYKSLGKKEKCHLEIHADHALFATEQCTLFGKLIHADQPLDLVQILNDHFPSDAVEQLVAVPKSFPMAIERAAIVLDDKMVECRTDVAIDDGMMKLVSKARGGKITADVSDNLSFPNHADVSTRFNPKLVKIGMAAFDSMLITKNAIIFCERVGKDVSSVFLVSTTS